MKRLLTPIILLLCLSGSVTSDTGPEMVTFAIDIPEGPPTVFYGPWHYEVEPTEEDLHCMALNIYFEARGESIEGQYAVAEIVMDRMMNHNFPNTICGVVKEGGIRRDRCQFSWNCDGKSDTPVDIQAWKVAMHIANQVMYDHKYIRHNPYALYYHADYVNPHWAAKKVQVAVIDNHIFYTSGDG